jgi:uncharacterized membrane protein YadS
MVSKGELMAENEPANDAPTGVERRDYGWRVWYKTEDYWAIWLGLILIVLGMLVFLPRSPEGLQQTIREANATLAEQSQLAPFRTIAWHEAVQAKQKLKATTGPVASFLEKLTGKPRTWSANPLRALVVGPDGAAQQTAAAEAKYQAAAGEAARWKSVAQQAEDAARAADFQDASLNAAARAAIDDWLHARQAEAAAAKKLKAAGPFNQVGYLVLLALFLMILFGIGIAVMGRSLRRFALGFLFVFALGAVAQTFAAQVNVRDAGLGYAAWAILLGLCISNTIGTPAWVRPALLTEFFIKTGLVLLGAEILLGKVLAIGIPGIFVAWVVTPIVLVCTYVFGQRVLKIPSKTLNITISADMSVCGVSAAIATAAACRAKKEELTLAVGLSLVFTSIMMVVMPMAIRALGMPDILGGAWIGGTIDATGAVAAAGEFLGDKALYVAATIKMIQNILIGVIAFGVAVYWCLRVETASGRTVGVGEIWRRFPKFVLGFLGVSLAFSLLYAALGSDVGYTLIDHGVIGGWTKHLRGWLFCLAFASIGLETNFRELRRYFHGGKPLVLYLCGQAFNLCLTLLMAYLMFYVVFRHITEQL